MHHVIHKMASVTVPQFSATLVKHATAPAQLDVLVAHALQCGTAQRNTSVIKWLGSVSVVEITQDVVLLQIWRLLSQVNSLNMSSSMWWTALSFSFRNSILLLNSFTEHEHSPKNLFTELTHMEGIFDHLCKHKAGYGIYRAAVLLWSMLYFRLQIIIFTGPRIQWIYTGLANLLLKVGTWIKKTRGDIDRFDLYEWLLGVYKSRRSELDFKQEKESLTLHISW